MLPTNNTVNIHCLSVLRCMICALRQHTTVTVKCFVHVYCLYYAMLLSSSMHLQYVTTLPSTSFPGKKACDTPPLPSRCAPLFEKHCFRELNDLKLCILKIRKLFYCICVLNEFPSSLNNPTGHRSDQHNKTRLVPLTLSGSVNSAGAAVHRTFGSICPSQWGNSSPSRPANQSLRPPKPCRGHPGSTGQGAETTTLCQ